MAYGDRLLQEIKAQLSRQQLYIKAGGVSIINASVIQAKPNCPNKRVNSNNTPDKEAGYHGEASLDCTQNTIV